MTMLTNSTYFSKLGGMAASLALRLNVVHIGIGLPLLVVSFLAMTMMGRRQILLIGTVGTTILWLSIGIAGCFTVSKQGIM